MGKYRPGRRQQESVDSNSSLFGQSGCIWPRVLREEKSTTVTTSMSLWAHKLSLHWQKPLSYTAIKPAAKILVPHLYALQTRRAQNTTSCWPCSLVTGRIYFYFKIYTFLHFHYLFHTQVLYKKNYYFTYAAEWLHQERMLMLHTNSHHQRQTLGI